MSALGLVDGGNPAADGVSSGGQQYAKGFPVAAAAWQHLMLLWVAWVPVERHGPQRPGSVLAPVRRAERLGRATPGDPLPVGVQERGQPGAVAAGALDRPTAPRPVAGDVEVGEPQELLVAGGVGPGRGLGQDPTDRADGGSRQGVTVGVDADGRRRRCLPGWACGCSFGRRPWSVSAWEESPRGTTVTGHNRMVGRAAIKPAR
jgi:hypothetical protein